MGLLYNAPKPTWAPVNSRKWSI